MTQDSDDAEAAGGWLFDRLPERGISRSGRFGLVGLDLNGMGLGNAGIAAIEAIEETVGWEAWLSRLPGRGKLEVFHRIGTHLWIFAGIPAKSKQSPQDYMEGLARRIQQCLQAEAARVHPIRTAALPARDRGFGTAVVAEQGDKPLRERLYEAFLQAVSRLQGVNRSEKAAAQGQELERILRDGDIRSAYQPIFHLRSGQLYGYEALTRCPKNGVFDGPLTLFHCAELEGYSFALDRLARETAIRTCPKLGEKQKIFINIHSGIMKDPHFVSGQTRQWLAARGLEPQQVVLEITERSSIDDFEEAKQLLNHYRSQGYQIAIDDAGAGYSSLQAIVELRPDYIKLDRSLVQKADRDEMKLQMLRTFVRFAKRMRILTVAEGIETPEELGLVRRMGIDFGQGYLIGRPSEQPLQIVSLSRI
ncbi:EAL domain-containing protein [Cohnella caldifontis]|uniref:EAL domain-containing protein n=1 Tax=Cohnella caldifontis TaxID=3027471 RepID=UPI0023EBBC7E|nr:EAL domain-containing protein [Cohnella sp. YIM B05605]